MEKERQKPQCPLYLSSLSPWFLLLLLYYLSFRWQKQQMNPFQRKVQSQQALVCGQPSKWCALSSLKWRMWPQRPCRDCCNPKQIKRTRRLCYWWVHWAVFSLAHHLLCVWHLLGVTSHQNEMMSATYLSYVFRMKNVWFPFKKYKSNTEGKGGLCLRFCVLKLKQLVLTHVCIYITSIPAVKASVYLQYRDKENKLVGHVCLNKKNRTSWLSYLVGALSPVNH